MHAVPVGKSTFARKAVGMQSTGAESDLGSHK